MTNDDSARSLRTVVDRGLARYCGMVWNAGVARKAHERIRCHVAIAKGNVAWRPLTNGKCRMNRLCGKCGDGAVVSP